jgi:hypothetical protein
LNIQFAEETGRRYTAVEWNPGVSVTSKNIPIIWMSKPFEFGASQMPEYMLKSQVKKETGYVEPEPGGYGNFAIDEEGSIVPYRDKLGRILYYPIHPELLRLYPSRQAAEADARAKREFLRALKEAKLKFKQGKGLIDAVILGVILLPNQFETLRRELRTVELYTLLHRDWTITPISRTKYVGQNGEVSIKFVVEDPKPEEKGYLFGNTSDSITNTRSVLTLIFYRSKEVIYDAITEYPVRLNYHEERRLIEIIKKGYDREFMLDKYDQHKYYFIPVTLP